MIKLEFLIHTWLCLSGSTHYNLVAVRHPAFRCLHISVVLHPLSSILVPPLGQENHLSGVYLHLQLWNWSGVFLHHKLLISCNTRVSCQLHWGSSELGLSAIWISRAHRTPAVQLLLKNWRKLRARWMPAKWCGFQDRSQSINDVTQCTTHDP